MAALPGSLNDAAVHTLLPRPTTPSSESPSATRSTTETRKAGFDRSTAAPSEPISAIATRAVEKPSLFRPVSDRRELTLSERVCLVTIPRCLSRIYEERRLRGASRIALLSAC